jgi:ABC-type phosphonate transport system ATPase subunit
MSVIEVDNLHKRYGEHVAVQDVSFAVEEGEIFGILGPSRHGRHPGGRLDDRTSWRVRRSSASCATSSASETLPSIRYAMPKPRRRSIWTSSSA